MIPRHSLIPAPVVAGPPRHDRLLIALFELCEELLRACPAQYRSLPTVVPDQRAAIGALFVAEA
jgi:hypothetical protein